MHTNSQDHGTSHGGTEGTSLPFAIELRKICKRFGQVQANKDIDLKVERGSIHGIVGENGAGKSTLMSILYGFYQADSGEILINGKPTRIKSSRDAIDAGIGMVHQHFMLVDTFTVLENVLLGAEQSASLEKSEENAHEVLQHLAAEYQLSVPLDAITGELPVGQQQRTEILKALYRNAEILILDEPTGVLTPQEADQLFRVLKALKERGVTIILITHKLREIMDITDNVSVLRLGEIVSTHRTADTSTGELAELMVGRKLETQHFDKVAPTSSEAGIDVKQITVTDDRGLTQLDNISFEVKRGEIVGIAGVAGNGQSELLEVLAGIQAPDTGEFTINGHRVSAKNPLGPSDMRDIGVQHVPEDRLRLGLIKSFSAAESSVLGYQNRDKFNWRMFLNIRRIREACKKLMQAFDVRPPDPTLKSASFSGGNQQKLILARELDQSPSVLLVGQPTRGVDIGAIELIHQKLIDMRDANCAILLVSVELDEIMTLSDRILVMFEGRIVGSMDGREADKTTLGLMMANAMPDPALSVTGESAT
jgi:simple sugar transport system ATP-binding protein